MEHTESTAGAAPAHRLASTPSPYLHAHQDNPVEWYPWGEEALALARRSGKPILLSIGYAACHWCHVMAHESFEDPATAAVMNAHFVNIKVDRELRPDLDRIYQLAHQLLSGRGGGWPLTMFLMHDDQRPFFGGTYFPREARFGLPAFVDLLRRVAEHYQHHREALRAPTNELVAALGNLNPPSPDRQAGGAPRLGPQPIDQCRERLAQRFDEHDGGFGPAPKFPQPEILRRLLRDWSATADAESPDLTALYLCTLTLTRMAEGGLFDHVGGGFFRYSVDAQWQIPHFEKMLYDNAQLLSIYAEAAAATGERLFADTARRTAAFLMRELGAADGGFAASLDADSEGHEGRFYTWRVEPVRALLEPGTYALFARRFGMDRPANFEGAWHLRVCESLDALATSQAESPADVERRLAQACERLLAERTTRVRPALDAKVLTGWNALAIAALAQAGTQLGERAWIERASEALGYLRRRHWADGRLLASSLAQQASQSAFLDDHAYLLEALLALLTARFRGEELDWALALAELLLVHFEDPEGGFFLTADDQETLIVRPKVLGDDATPAGNGVAARALARLGYLVGETRYLAAAERALQAAWPAMQDYPEGHASSLIALEALIRPPTLVVLRGKPESLHEWQQSLRAPYAPRRWVVAIPADAAPLPAGLAAKSARPGTVAYLCRGMSCAPPIDSLPALHEALAAEPR